MQVSSRDLHDKSGPLSQKHDIHLNSFAYLFEILGKQNTLLVYTYEKAPSHLLLITHWGC